VGNRHGYVQMIVQRACVQSVLAVMRPDGCLIPPFPEGCLYLVVLNEPQANVKWKQLNWEGMPLMELRISVWQLEKWALQGMDERLAAWLLHAEIVWDKDDFMKHMRQRLLRMPAQLQKRRICEEYSLLLRYFLQSKEFLQQGLSLDAYQSLMLALDAWARLIVIEAGELPDAAIWMRVKQLDPAVYKLYEELAASHELLQKRIELLLLPIDVCITSKLKDCARFVLDIMKSKQGAWLLQELLEHPELVNTRIELPLLLEKLAQRAIVQEITLDTSLDRTGERAYLLPPG
jgi:hypothetical protein